jgi:hypothetical protein
MPEHHIHESHGHVHRPGCGHARIEHAGHEDFLHDGHLHHVHGDHVDEHALEVTQVNPSKCTPSHACGGHAASHQHSATCEHTAVPHGDHIDYVVDGHLHHPCGTHCDDHGPVRLRG